jgi:hypothetical protein
MGKSVSEVEEILREIRLRVQQENLESTQLARRAAEDQRLDLGSSADIHTSDPVPPADASQIQSLLPTLERTRHNLPPITSYRKGLAARAELFVKRQIKRLTKWFTYDQVIFNNAVYETVLELQKVQAENAQEHARLLEHSTRLLELYDQLDRKISSHENISAAEIERSRLEIQERLTQLADQQTVNYKNLLIQMDEASQVADRSRHSLEERMTSLENQTRSK